jgi:hypothetical protein
MVTKSDIQALLEDGPEPAAHLAEWLEMDRASLNIVLNELQIPACERCGRRFLQGSGGASPYCSPDCSLTATSPAHAGVNSMPGAASPLETATPQLRPAGHARRRDDSQFEVIWSGIGPLPGAGAAAGLGSTLSGIHFSVGKRS